MVDEDTQEIVEAEVVEDGIDSEKEDQTTVLLSLEQLIKSHIASIDKLRDESRKYKLMLEDALINDQVYQEHQKAAKEATKQKTSTKQQIMRQPANVQISNKIREMSSELKDKQMALSDYLLEYQRMTGVNEIEGEDGEVREIINTAKVVKKK
ncbi:MAG TPA: hypothetical protein VF189_05135 [Patescibacteria group bacterium]